MTKTIARAHELGVLYADDDWAPLSDITLALLLKRAGIRWKYVALDGHVELVWPPMCGTHILLVERQLTPGERRFAVRHGLAHVLAGHVSEVAFARDGGGWQGYEESVADAVAWADLLPGRQLVALRAAGYSADELAWWCTCEMRRYVPTWSAERVADRLRTRLSLERGALKWSQ